MCDFNVSSMRATRNPFSGKQNHQMSYETAHTLNLKTSSNSCANACNALLWSIQSHFTGAELGRLVRSTSSQGVLPRSLFSDPSFLRERAVETLTHDRRCTLGPVLNGAHTTQNSMPLLNRFEIETLLHRRLPADFPLALRYAGNPEILKKRRVALVGSRHPTFYGREQTARFARALAEQGVCVVSGAAIGVDTVANMISHAFGSSAAVLGSGLQCPYPKSNQQLLKAMATSGRGLILSEFDDLQRAEKWNFPRRNRIIAALCDFLMVIEAASASGTLITAHLAADCGIDVGALPGPVHSPNSQGSNQLIKEGAFCIESPEEILERFINLGHQEEQQTLENSENEPVPFGHTLSSLF